MNGYTYHGRSDAGWYWSPEGVPPLLSVHCWVGVGRPWTEQDRVTLSKRMAVRGEEVTVTVGLTGGGRGDVSMAL